MEDAEAPPAQAVGRVKRLASSAVAAAIAAAGPARRHESPVTASPPAGSAGGGQASPELPFAHGVDSHAPDARVSPPGSGAASGGAAGRKPAGRKPARLSDVGGSSDIAAHGTAGLHGGKASSNSVRPTNNQLTYMVQLHWEHFHLPLHAAVRATLRDATDQCASVTTAFLQVLATLCDAESGRPDGGRNILALLASNTRRTKVVSLSTGTHRVPDELRRHTLTDVDGVQYSTNLDRNRYGADTQYLNTVLRHDLAALGLCPQLLTVVIHDVKKRGALELKAEVPCCCSATGGPLPPPPALFAPPAPRGSAADAVAARGTVTMGGIGLLLDALAACGFRPPPSPFASGKGAAQQATASAYAAGAFAGLSQAAAITAGAVAGGALLHRVPPFSPAAAAAAALAKTAQPAGAPRRRLLPLMSPGGGAKGVAVAPLTAAEGAAAEAEGAEASEDCPSACASAENNVIMRAVGSTDDDVAVAAPPPHDADGDGDAEAAQEEAPAGRCGAPQPLRRRRTAAGRPSEAALAAAVARAAAAEAEAAASKAAAEALAAENAALRAALAGGGSTGGMQRALPPPPPFASPATLLGKHPRDGSAAAAAAAGAAMNKRPRARLGSSPPTPAAGATSAALLRAAALQSPPVAIKAEEAPAAAAAAEAVAE